MIPIILNQHFLPLPCLSSLLSFLPSSFLSSTDVDQDSITGKADDSILCYDQVLGLPQWLSIKESACNAGDVQEMD